MTAKTQTPKPEKTAEKRADVISAALKVFQSYGYRRTSMQDVAEAAAISRASLYLMFASKEALFEAVVASLQVLLKAQIDAEIEALEGAAEKIERACLIWGLKGYEFVEQYPNSADMFDLERPAVKREYDRFQTFLASLFDAADRAGIAAMPAIEKARLTVFSIRGFKETASDAEDLSDLISMQVALLTQASR